jgi:hypothetical protein
MPEYPNRSDLRNPTTRKVAFTGQTYGQAAQQVASQQAVAPGSAPGQVQAQQAARQVPAPRPGAKPLFRPTERPGEPLTAGAEFGPGTNDPGLAVITPGIIPDDPVLDQLKILYSLYPNDGLALLLSRYWGSRV